MSAAGCSRGQMGAMTIAITDRATKVQETAVHKLTLLPLIALVVGSMTGVIGTTALWAYVAYLLFGIRTCRIGRQ